MITFKTFILLLTAVVCLPKSAWSQAYKNFRITPAQYQFRLSDDQILSSDMIELNELKSELWRSVRFPKSTIEVFDTGTGKLKRKIIPQGVSCNAFKIMANGTIWIQIKNGYALIDAGGKVIKKYDEPLIGTQGSVDMFTGNSAFSPIVVTQGYVMVTGYMIMLQQRNYTPDIYADKGVVRSFGPDGQISYLGKLPIESIKNYYGGLNRYSITENKGKLVVAPFYSNNIQVIDPRTKSVTFYKASTTYDRSIRPLGNFDEHVKFTNAQASEHFTGSTSFIGLVYDKYRNVYYRFIRHPGNALPIRCAIAVMNADFKVLFYKEVPQSYDPARFFIDKKGLLIANDQAYRNNTGLLTFDLFTLTTI